LGTGFVVGVTRGGVFLSVVRGIFRGGAATGVTPVLGLTMLSAVVCLFALPSALFASFAEFELDETISVFASAVAALALPSIIASNVGAGVGENSTVGTGVSVASIVTVAAVRL
jgi:hypothetical protein